MLKRLLHYRAAAFLGLGLVLAACATYTGAKIAKQDYGVRAPHAKHMAQGMSCTDCHDIGEKATIKGHDACSVCHDIDIEKQTPDQCKQCHTKDDMTLVPRTSLLSTEVKFNHEKHVSAKVDCAKCHTDPDKGALLITTSKMQFCMDCHATVRPELNDCSVCHTQISKSTRPQFRHGARIAHDSPGLWEKQHGREWRFDEKFCATCHTEKSFCEDCHSQKAPKDHTATWRRETHGDEAQWDRARCAACHEEDMCIKCHKSTEPSFHRAGWGDVLNRHCVNCHYPPQRTECSVCHEDIDHKNKGALPSPHVLGVYPPQCGACHPGGNPYRAPHLLNSTTTCKTCH